MSRYTDKVQKATGRADAFCTADFIKTVKKQLDFRR